MSLFRPEVSQQRRERLHGAVVLTQPVSARYIAYAIFIIIVIAIAWLTTGTYARIETVPGIVTTSKPSAKVIAQVPGVVANLRAKDGDVVQKGQPLLVVRLERISESGSEVTKRSLEALGARRVLAKDQVNLSFSRAAAEKSRLAGIARGAEQAAADLRKQIDLQKEAVISNKLLFERLSHVVSQGFVSQVEFERRRQAMISSQQTLGSLEQQLNSKLADAQEARAQATGLELQAAQGVSEIQSSVEALVQQEAQMEGEQAYVVRAPISGRVTAVQTTEGRTAMPNIPLMVIVPTGSELRAELYAPTRAIGFVKEGQEARILYDAFPYQRFGSFGGQVSTISRMIIDPRETEVPLKLEEPVYRIDVVLDRQAVEAQGKAITVQPGMTLKANIVLERQSFLAWLLKPLYAVLRRGT